MYCPECGHQNPTNNRFCGMCGERLPERAANTSAAKSPTTSEMHIGGSARITERHERIAEHDPEPVPPDLRDREPVDETVRESALPAAVADYYASRREQAAPAEELTTLSGPSFLGLSSTSGSSSGYSYLYEDEQPRSHAGSLAFLLVLALIGLGVYWKWQPIRDFVVNAALTHSQTGRAPQNPAPIEGSSTASSDNTAPQAGQPTNPNGQPQQESAASSTDQPKTDTQQPKDQHQAAPASSDSEKTNAPKDERPQSEVGRVSRFRDVKGKRASNEDSPEEDETPSTSRTARAAGTELVASGERYLYGRGVARSCNQALVNFQAAAKQENPRAMSHLGSLYATGQCVPLDRAQAYQWFSRALAVDRSNTYIEHNLNMLWRDMSSAERAKATQRRMF